MSSNNLCRAMFSLACLTIVSTSRHFADAYPSIEPMNYTDVNDPDVALMGYLTLPSALAAQDDSTDDTIMIESLPAVVILPDWDNVNDYEITRATMISEELGYIAFTADIYGADLHDVQDFGAKIELSTKYRSDPALFNSRIESAIQFIKSVPFVDPTNVAIVGYCLGGTGVLGYSFSNVVEKNSGIVGGVSFHGGLMDFNVTGEMASPVLVLSGGNDDAGTDVEVLEATLKEANATWQITRYSGVNHAFTKFDAADYNEWVDMRSWMEMASFLKERFGELEYGSVSPTLDVEYKVEELVVDPPPTAVVERMSSAGETRVTVTPLSYTDDEGFALEGHLARPPQLAAGETRPAILILPDWDGVNGPTGYEVGRAVLSAKEGGYVALVADIYGTEYTDVDDMATRIELTTVYRNDPDLFVKRIQAGVDQLVAHPSVDSSRIFVAGYCFGGTGAIDYAFSAGALENVRAVVPIHGGLNPLRAVQTDAVHPYVLILSGGVDDAHGNPTELEAHLDGASATWEISRYSNAAHGFTKWGTGPFSAYNAMADSRSWMSMMSLFDTLSTTEVSTEMKEENTGGDSSSMTEPKEDNDPMSVDMDMLGDSSAVGHSVLGAATVVAGALFAALLC